VILQFRAGPAADALVLGGDTAVPGGECAPDASSGFDATGVMGVYGPGSVHGVLATDFGASLPAILRLAR
jgi:hypothetical protein